MDRLTCARQLRRVARAVQSLGLPPAAHFGTRVLKLAFGDTYTVTRDGVRISGVLEHADYLDALRAGRREPFMTKLFEAAVGPGMVVVDLGAFLGQYALLAARRMGERGTVYAFEPDPRSFASLVRNIQANNLGDRVTAVSKAVTDRSGSVSFFLHAEHLDRSGLYRPPGAARHTTVECVSLDAFSGDETGVDVIKMDVEGAELLALDGMERTLTRNPGPTMFVEWNPGALRRAGASGRALIDRLAALGFSVLVIDEDRRCLAPVYPDREPSRPVNLYCQRDPERSPPGAGAARSNGRGAPGGAL